MQKFINVLALLSFGVSASIVGAGAYVYMNQEEIKEELKQRATAEIGNLVQGQLGNALFGGSPELPGGDLPDPTRFDESGAVSLPVSPF